MNICVKLICLDVLPGEIIRGREKEDKGWRAVNRLWLEQTIFHSRRKLIVGEVLVMQYHLGQNTLKIQCYFQFCEYTLSEQASQILMVKILHPSSVLSVQKEKINNYKYY